MTDMHPMHLWFCEQTRQNARRTWNYETMRLWAELLAEHDAAAVFAVLKHLIAEIEAKRRNPGALRLRNFLQPDEFADNLWLAEHKGRLRAPKPPPGLAPRQLGNMTVLIEQVPPAPPPADDMRRQVSAGLRGLADSVRQGTTPPAESPR